MLGIAVLAPRTGRIAMITVIRSAISTGTARGCSAMLTGRRIVPCSIAHAVAGIIIVRRAAVSAGTCAPMLTGRILLPRAIAIAVTTRIDCFGFCLTASAGVRTVAVAGTGGSLLILKNPCMAAAVRAGTGTVTTSAVTLIGVSAKVLDVVAEITLILRNITLSVPLCGAAPVPPAAEAVQSAPARYGAAFPRHTRVSRRPPAQTRRHF